MSTIEKPPTRDPEPPWVRVALRIAQSALAVVVSVYAFAFFGSKLRSVLGECQLYWLTIALPYLVLSPYLVFVALSLGILWCWLEAVLGKRKAPVLDTAVLIAWITVIIATPLALLLALSSESHLDSLRFEGRVYYLSSYSAGDGDGQLRLYECDRIGLCCRERQRQSITFSTPGVRDAQLAVEPLTHRVVIALPRAGGESDYQRH